MNEGLKPKQLEFQKAFQSEKFRYLMGAGTTGSGKSFEQIGCLHLLCKKIPKLRFAVIRKSEKNLKQTSIPTYNKLKRVSKSYTSSHIGDMTARYANGSEILFIWADITKDPDLDNIKGLELTGALIEEANQVDKKYFDLLKTRIGRWNNHRVPKFIMLNMNPTGGWCKELFYDNFMDKTLPEGYYFLEFDEHDTQSIIDTPDSGIDKNYLEDLKDLPPEEYGRYVKNSWEYAEIENQLVRYEWYRDACLDRYVIKKTDRGLLAIDPADQGKDSTVGGRMHGNHIGWWEEYAKQDPGDSGLIFLERARECGISQSDTIIDAIGVGSGTITAMRLNNFYPHLFISGNNPVREEGFLKTHNKRAEAHWMFREDLRMEEITLEHNPKLQKECTKCQYIITDKVIKILPKEELKKAKYIGWSPGHLDVATMLNHRRKTASGDLGQGIMDKHLNDILNRNQSKNAQRDRLKRRKV